MTRLTSSPSPAGSSAWRRWSAWPSPSEPRRCGTGSRSTTVSAAASCWRSSAAARSWPTPLDAARAAGSWSPRALWRHSSSVSGSRTPVLLLPYLLIPALLAGIGSGCAGPGRGHRRDPGTVVVHLPPFGSGIVATVGTVAPWIIAVIGSALLGAWLRQVRLSHAEVVDHASYEDARRLLSQLRTVARRLSSGLDPVSMADQLLPPCTGTSTTPTPPCSSAPRGVCWPRWATAGRRPEKLLPEGRSSTRAGPRPSPRTFQQPAPPSTPLPGGAAAAEGLTDDRRGPGRHAGGAPTARAGHTDAGLRRAALRLDTALVFDEVRTLATAEERQRLAREIHDGVAQEFASLGYIVDDLGATDLRGAARSCTPSRRDHPRGQRAAAVDLRPAQRDHARGRPGRRRSPTTSGRSAPGPA